MENRENVVAEYFQLRVLLNKTNLRKDEKTEVVFLLRHNQEGDVCLVAALAKISPSKAIEICGKPRNGSWRGSEYSGLFYLEDYCAKFLNSGASAKSEASEIEILILDLDKNLRNLGISR